MEGTSGAADLGALRGATGEAALGLGGWLRKQLVRRTVPGGAVWPRKRITAANRSVRRPLL
jgi:hypothetical protein